MESPLEQNKVSQTVKKNNAPDIKKLIGDNKKFRNDITRLENILHKLETEVFESKTRSAQAELRAGRADIRCMEADRKSTQNEKIALNTLEKSQEAYEKSQEAYKKVQHLESIRLEIIATLKSPLKMLKFILLIIKKIFIKIKVHLINLIKKVLQHTIVFISSRPKLKKTVLYILDKFPSLKKRLKNRTIHQREIYNAQPEECAPRVEHIYRILQNKLIQYQGESK